MQRHSTGQKEEEKKCCKMKAWICRDDSPINIMQVHGINLSRVGSKYQSS